MQEHRNNIGVLRLLFASLVIVGHAPEQVDGNRSRELLSAWTSTISLGEVSVIAFFLLSGFLITKSMASSTTLVGYARRRIARILPGYVVAFLVSVFVFGAFFGAEPWLYPAKALGRLAVLRMPSEYPSDLHTPYPVFKGAMWTIAYEFRCYIMVAVFGSIGLLRHRPVIAAITAASLLAQMIAAHPAIHVKLLAFERHTDITNLIGTPLSNLQLVPAFLVGACFYLYRDLLLPRLSGVVALIALVLAGAAMFRNPVTAQAGLALFGGVALFWLAFKARIGSVQRINDRWDVSYGTYLYGWPIATAILYLYRDIHPPCWRSPLCRSHGHSVRRAGGWWRSRATSWCGGSDGRMRHSAGSARSSARNSEARRRDRNDRRRGSAIDTFDGNASRS